MSLFWYEATDANGERVTGEIEADSVAASVQKLVHLGLSIHGIRQVPEETVAERIASAAFESRVAKLLERKSQWLPALRAMAGELPVGGVRNEMQSMVNEVAGELTVSQFLSSRYAATLLPLFSAGLDEAEPASHSELSTIGSQRLHDWLDAVSKQLENRVQRRNKWVYPVVLLSLVSLAVVVCLTTIVPTFKAMFNDFGLALPVPTLLAIQLSDQLVLYWPRTIVIVSLFVLAMIVCIRVLRSRSVANRLLGRFAAGTTSNLAAMSAFISALAELLSLKAPVPLAVRYAGVICNHSYFRELSDQFAADAGQPAVLHFSESARRWPPLLIQAMQSGEGGQPNIRLLRELAAMYSDRIGSRLEIGTDILPAAATFFIGIAVAFIVIALFMPLISMITALS